LCIFIAEYYTCGQRPGLGEGGGLIEPLGVKT